MIHATTRPFMVLSLVLLLSYAGSIAQDKKPQKQKKDDTPTKNLMTQKLEHAQKLLAAVAQNDYAYVEKNAQELIRISKELAWKHIRTDRYNDLSREYRVELEYLVKAAKLKNNEALALGYVKTSLACFNCHNHVREVRIAQP